MPGTNPLYDVVESAWRVDAGFGWHAVRIAEHDRVGKLYFYGRPPFLPRFGGYHSHDDREQA